MKISLIPCYRMDRSIKYRDLLYRILKNTDQSSSDFAVFKQNLAVCNILLKKAMIEAKTTSYENEINRNRTNMRKMWNTISEIIHKSKNKSMNIKNICVWRGGGGGGDLILFINIGPKLSNDMGHVDENSYRKYLNHSILTSFGLTKTLNSLRSKPSAGYDGISTRLLKTISPALIEPLRIIINHLSAGFTQKD